MAQRLLVISPVHNEAEHMERVARAVAAQRRPPDAWIVVDDASTDQTLELLREIERELDFMTVLSAPPMPPAHGRDRLAQAAEISAFNHGLESLDWRSFTHIAKLDGDVELPVDWYRAAARDASSKTQRSGSPAVSSPRSSTGAPMCSLSPPTMSTAP